MPIMSATVSAKVLYPELSYSLRGVFYEVYNVLATQSPLAANDR
jgi:hypothetical protein